MSGIRKVVVCAIALFVSAALMPLQGAAVTWYLSNVRFSDGGTATGSFVWNADAVWPLIDFDIQTSAGANGLGMAYDWNVGHSESGNPTSFWLYFNDASSSDTLRLAFDGALTNAGGTVPLYTSDTWEQSRSFPQDVLLASRYASSGFVTTTSPVPEPATTGLALSAVAAFLLVRRSR